MSPKEKSSMMLSLAIRWQESGLTQVRYAEMHNITIHALRYWLYKRKESQHISGGFIQLKAFTSAPEYIVRYPNGVELKISSDTPLPVIRSLVNL